MNKRKTRLDFDKKVGEWCYVFKFQKKVNFVLLLKKWMLQHNLRIKMCYRYYVSAIFQSYCLYMRVMLFESRSLMVFRIYAKKPVETLRCF